MFLSIHLCLVVTFISIYPSMPLFHSDCSPPLQLPCQKINQGRDVFTHKHTKLPTSPFSIVPCSVCSQARMYEINYNDQQFFIITKPPDKNSLNWPVGSGLSRLGLQIYFLLDAGCAASSKAIQVIEVAGKLVCRAMLSSKRLLVREAPFPVTRLAYLLASSQTCCSLKD